MAAVLTVGSISAFAEPISFSICRSDGVKAVAYNTKDLSGSTWYISNNNTSYSNFIENGDIIGFKVKGRYNDVAYSDYHTFSRFVSSYPLSYTSTPALGTNLKLNAQVDSNGQYSCMQYEGEWVS